MISYDEWIKICVATKAATGGSEEGFALFDAWSSTSSRYDPEITRQKWDSFKPPYRIGFRELAAMADEKSGGQFGRARFDFDVVDVGHRVSAPDESTDIVTPDGEVIDLPAFVYREPTREWVRTRDSAVMKVDTFNDCREGQRATSQDLERRMAAWAAQTPVVAKDKPKASSAHNILKGQALMVQTLTYMPAKPKLFARPGRPGDWIFNLYNPPSRPYSGMEVPPAAAALMEELFEHVLPNEEERTLFLDWMTFIAQNPGRKVQWAPVLFSRTQGVGKDTVLKILRYGVVGRENMQSIEPARLESEFNADWAVKQVILVPEVPSFHKRDLYDKLKDLVASGAGSLSVNPKGLARFEVPNSHCWVMTSNKPDALQLELEDRRFAILHAREARMPKELRDRVKAFMDFDEDTEHGSMSGYHIAGEWVRARRLQAAFDPYECRLVTEAKSAMMIETLPDGAARIYGRATNGDWAKRQVIGVAEAREWAVRGARPLSYADTRKALELAGFVLPDKRDGRNRVNVGTSKVELWVRGVFLGPKGQGGSGLEAENLDRGLDFQSVSQRTLAETWARELEPEDFQAAAKIKEMLGVVPLTTV